MKRSLLRREGETLGDWIERLTKHIDESNPNARTIHEILHEVSVVSYVAGVHAEQEINKKHTSTKQ